MRLNHCFALSPLIFLMTQVFAQDVAQYVCTIGGVYENVNGKLVQRSNDKALGEQIFINAETGEVTGYFGTDGFNITRIRRPDEDGLLTIETATGIDGNAANRLRVSAADAKTRKHTFVYTKNWLIVSGECSAVRRHQ